MLLNKGKALFWLTTVIFLIVFNDAHSQGAPPYIGKWGYDSNGFIYSKKGDSVATIAGSDTVWFSANVFRLGLDTVSTLGPAIEGDELGTGLMDSITAAYDSSQVGLLNPADANVDTAAWNAGGSGEANTISDTGAYNETEGFGLAGGKTGVALKVKGLIEGSNITIAKDGDSALTITSSGGAAWVASNDTMFMVDGDGDTLAAFWDDDAGNVWWQVATEDQTLRILVDTIGINGDVIKDFTGSNLSVTAGVLNAATGGAGGWTDDGNHVRLTTAGDSVAIGRVNPYRKLHVYSSADDIEILAQTVVSGGDAGLGMEDGYSDYFIGTVPGDSFALVLRVSDIGTEQRIFLVRDSTLFELLVDTFSFGGDRISDFTGTNLSVTAGVLNAAGGAGLDTTEVLDILRDSISGDGTVGAGGAFTVVDDLHDHVYSNIDATTSADWITRVSDETGTGVWVFGTSPTFTTDITSPLVIGGTGTASDLSLKTTSGVGATGADMHFLVGDNGATEAITILNNGNVGIGITNPDELLHLFANNAALKLEDDSENDATISVGNSQLCIAIDPGDLVVSSDICFDIDGDEVARLHQNTNFGIGTGTATPPERITVVGNIATGDTTTGDVDVFHYFSTNGSWTTEYFKWDDGLGRFELSDDFDVTGNVTVSGTVDTVDVGALAAKVHNEDLRHFGFSILDPNAVFDIDSLICIKPVTEKAITVTRIDVTCDADPTTEPAMSLRFADNFISRTTPTTIDVITTTAGVTTITSGFDDATIPASNCVYFVFTADPEAALKSITVDITYTID